jgi:hypothetical protein
LSKKNINITTLKKNPMTETAVQAQVNTINKATQMALRSKEAAKKFLADAGIIKKEKAHRNQSTKKKK